MELIKQNSPQNEFVTVVTVGTVENNYENLQTETTPERSADNGFVTVLTIGDDLPNRDLTQQLSESVEEILVYRLPGERLGFGLKFEGGTKTTECVRRLFIQSCAPDSPASRVKCSWGSLAEGDEVLKIDNYSVKNMTRIDCVRSLKDSNVVIKLIVKHNNHSSKISLNSSFNSDDEFSGEEMEKRDVPPPPPIPPRKIKGNKEKMIPQPRDSLDVKYTNNTFPKSAPRTRLETPPKVPVRDRKLSEPGSIPPDAEVYLDLLSQELEYGIKTESESDDTGSTISTVIDRHNSNFMTSNSSSIASDSMPSTPTAVQKQLDLTKVVNPFEMLELEYASNIKTNNDFLFTRFVTSHDILFETDLKAEVEKNSLIPPANFQDAPLSYGNEDVTNMAQEEAELNKDIENSFGELDKKEEELKIPKPVPRKCYAKKVQKEDPKDFELPSEIVDVNLPRLVNFLPKNPTKVAVELNAIHLQDENEQLFDEYMCADTCELIECNNNTCDKIISCSTWSLSSQLETIGEIEEETDSLDSKTERYDLPDSIIADIKMSNEKYEIIDNFHNVLVQEDHDKLYPPILTTNDGDYRDKNDRFNYNTDKRKSIYNNNHSKCCDPIDMNTNCTMAPCGEQEHEITVLNLSENGQKSQNTEVEIKPTINSSEHLDQMDVSNFIQSEQNHTITTSEYSSLSSLSSPPLSFSPRVPSDGTDYSATEVESTNHQSQSLKLNKAPLEKAHMSLEHSFSVTESPAKQTNTRSSIWKKDEQSSKSIKDKIAIFSAENTEPLLPQEFSRVSKAFKSSENITEDRTLGKYSSNISKSCANVDKCSLVETSIEIAKNGTETSEESKIQVPTFTKPNIRLHTRSQSMLDMSSLDSPWNNSESRRQTLNSLIEQRRKGISKLRGLIIPQTEVPVEPVLDLPEIRSKEAEALSKMRVAPSERSKSDSMEPINYQRSSLQSSSWKNNSITTSTLPRYSPAFKRKCLQVYVMEQSSSSNSSKHDDKIEDEVFSKNNNFTENYSYTKSQARIKSAPAEAKFELNHSKNEPNKPITPLETPRRPAILPRSKPDLDRVTDDSDNDSAVSSSQSSYNISRECSPLPSPLDYTNNSLLATDHNGINGRVLKPQSVEAINRKNILASAKFRSGRDYKNGSPLIQRKLSGTEEDKVIIEECQEDESNLEYEGVSSDELDIKSISSSSSMTVTEPAIISEVKLIEQYTIVDSDIQECADEPEPELPLTPPPKLTPLSSDGEPYIKPLNLELAEITTNSEDYIKLLNLDVSFLNSEDTTTTHLNSELNSTKPSNLAPKPSIPTVVLRSTVRKQPERPTSMLIPTTSRYDSSKRASVTDIRKQFEKFELENQKSPTSPDAKPIVSKKIPPVKSAKVLDEPKLLDTKIEVLIAKVSNGVVHISKEDLKVLINDFNDGLDPKNCLFINEIEVIEILIQREYSGGSIGITLTGGTDYETKEITVHKVINGGCAHKDGRLKKGDRILSINGRKMMGVTHKESIEILKDPQPEVTFIVVPMKENSKLPASPQAKSSPEPLMTNNTEKLPTPSESKIHKVELIKDGAGLGFSLDGGKDSPKGDKPLMIKKIFTGGSADKCGQLKAGDELLEVNAVEVHKMTRIEGWSLMKKLPDGKVTLTIRR